MTRGLTPHVPLPESGIPWLGEIPAHWGIWKIGHFAAVGNGSTPNRDNADYWTEGLIPWLNSSVVNQEEVTEADQFITETAFRECHLPLVKSGSVLVGITGQGKTRGQAVVLSFEATINQHLAFITPKQGMADPWFLRWALFAAYDFLRSISDDAGGTKGALTCEEVGALRIPLPPIDEQCAIAAHLNREMARLDGLVAAKERVLGLVAEKRRALITRAVTRGLDSSVPLRDSGIPWLDKIPAHWTATRMKFLATEPLAYGANEAALEDEPTFPRFVRITDIDSDGNLRDETFKSLPPQVAEPYLLRDGDVLLARSGATVGKTFIYKPTWGVACFAGYLIRCRCNTALMQPDFLFAYTQTEPYWWQVREGTIQATIQNFSAEKYGDLVVTVPPLEEQKAIIAHIATETAKLDALRTATERTIALLKERRAALIAAAVTGQIEVEEAA
jgi:type I restriction enzyme S subunit